MLASRRGPTDSIPCFSSQELDLLKEDANVYKLIGPVLVKQDLAEANANVRKRIEYISGELYASSQFPKFFPSVRLYEAIE